MGLFSILPEEYMFIELWIARLFIIFGVITLGPWVFLMLYDFVLYIVRSVTYEIPFVGGRARGKARPRAPSLTERPSGHRRKFSLARLASPNPHTHSSRDEKMDALDSPWRSTQDEKREHNSSMSE